MTDITKKSTVRYHFVHINRMRNASIQLNAEVIKAVGFLLHTQNANGISYIYL